jgi:N4-gp56 family major capsid protein
MTEGNWAAIQANAMKGGLITKNPLFTGALGMWNNTLIFEDARVCFGDNEQACAEYHTDLGAPAAGTTDIARAVFCGAQAAVFGVGRTETYPERMRWVEELEDGENQLNIYAGMVFGIHKCRFDGVDFGTIVVSTYSPGED